MTGHDSHPDVGAIWTLSTRVRQRAAATPDRVALTFVEDGVSPRDLTYGELHRRAVGLADAMGPIAASAVVALPGPDLVVALFGCWYGGVTPTVVASTAASWAQPSFRTALANLIDGAPQALLTSRQLQQMRARLVKQTPGLEGVPWIDPMAAERSTDAGGASTRGVALVRTDFSGPPTRLTFDEIERRLEHMQSTLRLDPEDVTACALPIDTVDGLCAGVLEPLLTGHPAVLVSAFDAHKRPTLLLETIEGHAATLVPIDAALLQLCNERVGPQDKAALDLSCWARTLLLGEVEPRISERFARTFARCGFRATVTAPNDPATACPPQPRAQDDLRIREWLIDQLADYAAVPAHRIDASVPFAMYGVGSKEAVEMAGDLERWLGHPVAPTAAYDHPTIDQLAAHLAGRDAPRATFAGARDEPIAIIGAGCRVPGAEDLESFWRVLRHGVDTIRDVPPGRFDVGRYYDPNPDAPGKMYTKRGGFIDNVDRFDPAFFGIAKTEADALDPQQRLLLEVAWEALENAFIVPSALNETRTGVFIGISSFDYARRTLFGDDPTQIDAYAGTGASFSTAAGRLAYSLGLGGPTLAVDTACSSSLVAIHLACQSLRNGESDTAIAGGVNLILAPEGSIYLSRLKALSPDGRCKTFDESADGYVRGEGCGLVVLKPLSAATADGDRIFGVIRGSAVNQDGRSNGLTAPNGSAQRAVIEDAIARAHLEPNDIDYFEAHGTGTPLGDPIELGAVGAVVKDRLQPAIVGSVKTNVGHLEAAAGVTGLIKVLLAFEHETIPAHLHLKTPSSRIPWAQLNLRVPHRAESWLRAEKPRRAGISSFGLSGTNAHLIVEEGPPHPTSDMTARAVVIPVSGRTSASLQLGIERLLAFVVDHPAVPMTSLAYTASSRREHFAHRATITANDHESLVEALENLAQGRLPADCSTGSPSDEPGKIAFVFSGQGSQYAGMAHGLYAADPVFKAALDACAAHLDKLLAKPLLSLMFAKPASFDAALLDQTAYTQPCLFALQYALVQLWTARGVKPAVVLGHSVGEIAAACCAGVLSLDDACRLVAARGRYMQALDSPGAMVSIRCDESTVAEVIEPYAETVAIAAVNAADQVVISGAEPDVVAVAKRFDERGIQTRRLAVSHAFHSPLMQPMLGDLERALRSITLHPPQIDVVCNASGGIGKDAIDTPEYWTRHVIAPVRFADGVATLFDAGVTTFVEIGPKATLLGLIARAQDAVEPTCIPSLADGVDDVQSTLRAAGQIYCAGHDIDWSSITPDAAPTRLPTYAFDRRRCWIDAPSAQLTKAVSDTERRLWSLVDAGRADDVAELLGLQPAPQPNLHQVVTAMAALRAQDHRTAIIRDWGHEIGWRPAPGRKAEIGRRRGNEKWAVFGDAPALAVALNAPLFERFSEATDEYDHLVFCGDLERAISFAQFALTAPGRPRCWFLTRSAVSLGDDGPPNPDAAMVRAFARVFSLEQPASWGGSVDAPPALDARIADQLGVDAEDDVAIRETGRFAARLSPRPLDGDLWRPKGSTALITGGLGAIGRAFAVWLAAYGVRTIVLVSRRGGDHPDAAAVIDAIEKSGAQVCIEAADCRDADAMAAMIDRYPDLSIVVHAAGTAPRSTIDRIDPDHLETAMAAKVDGLRVLDALVEDRALEAFVVISSIAAAWGSVGQASYAAANAYLDAWAEAARARGRPASSVAFGPWRGGGLADEHGLAELERRGVRGLDPAAAIDATACALASGAAHTIVADVDWPTFRPIYETVGRRPFVEDMAPLEFVALTQSDLADRLAALPDDNRQSATEDWLATQVADLLGEAHVDRRTGFFDLGFDSLMALELEKRVGRSLGIRVPANAAFDHPNVRALARHLLEQLELTQAQPTIESSASATDEPIAIVGVGCRLPGGANNLDALWTLLDAGEDAVGPIGADRWDHATYYDPDPDAVGRTYVRNAAFTDGPDRFDAAFFGITPREAQRMDPQHRLLLETAWAAFEDAAIVPGSLADSQTGIFVGIGPSDYALLLQEATDAASIDAYSGTGTNTSFAAGRLSHVLGLQGPSLAVDTACSSSLVALHLACRSLQAGECGVALAGGVQLMLSPLSFVYLSRTRAVAQDGRCKTFSAEADGYGRGEGCGVVVLQRLSDAIAEDRRILAVVRGSAVNHDGASSGLTVPNGRSQQLVLRNALTDAGLAAGDIEYVEAHGTGTALGDPIEVQALTAVYGGRETPLGIGSIKSNIGHLESAAGIAGVLKVVAALRHDRIPAHLHAATLNPHIPWDDIAVEVTRDARPWGRRGPKRRAGVSAFGLSGTNAHVIIEGAPDIEAPAAVADRACLIPVSARSEAALARVLTDVSSRLTEPGDDLFEVAWALGTSRTHHPIRAAVVASASARASTRLQRMGAKAQPVLRRLTHLYTGRPGPVSSEALRLHVPAYREAIGVATAAIRATGIDHAQLDLLASQFALGQTWRRWGLVPDAIIGHGQGELAAACSAGVLPVEDAVKLLAAELGAIERFARPGVLAAVQVDRVKIQALIDASGATIETVAINDAKRCVVWGEESAIDRLLRYTRQVEVRATRIAAHAKLSGEHAARAVESIGRVAQSIAFAEPMCTLHLASAGPESATASTPQFWERRLTRVSDLHAIASALSGFDGVVEVGPQSGLLGCVVAEFENGRGWPSVAAEEDPYETMLGTAAALYTAGRDLDWSGLYEGTPPRQVDLPIYPFERTRHWFEPSATANVGPVETRSGRWALSGAALTLPSNVEHRVLSVSTARQPYLADHVVHGEVIVPGAFHLAAVLAAASDRWPDAPLRLDDVRFVRPLVLTGAGCTLHVVFTPDRDETRFEVCARDERDWQTFAEGRVGPTDDRVRPLGSNGVMQTTIDRQTMFDALSALRIDWGPRWRWIQSATADHREAQVTFTPVEGSTAVAPLHPTLLDNAFASGLAVALAAGIDLGETPQLPFAVESLTWLRPPRSSVRCVYVPRRAEIDEATLSDISILDDRGECAQVRGFATKRAPRSAFLRADDAPMFETRWRLVDGPPVLSPPTESSDQWTAIEIDGNGRFQPPEASTRSWLVTVADDLDAAHAADAIVSATRIAARATADDVERVVFLTSGAVSVAAGEPVNPAAAAIWGFARAWASEDPTRSILRVDGAGVTADDASALGERELARRDGRWFVPRLIESRARPAPPSDYQLVITERGALDQVALVERSATDPAPGEVTVRVDSSGLNFRDVVNVLGLVGDLGPLGGEFSGTIVAAGDGVDRVAVGDRVIGVGPGCFARWVTVDARLVVAQPKGLGADAAATIPIAFLTAWIALHDIAEIRHGERVLVHAAAGGVGMAAVQLAARAGAEVYATASPLKQDELRRRGVANIANSRTAEFESAFGAANLDVVLNALAGELTDAGLRLLGDGGRFVEMGKTDLRDPADVQARYPGVHYRPFDLAVIMRDEPDRIQAILANVVAAIDAGELAPLPATRFSIDDAASALRFMARARHVGKIVLTPPRALDADDGATSGNDGATALITGGLGALGLRVAIWLAESKTAANIVLVGRSEPSPQAQSTIESIRSMGVGVHVARADVGDRREMAEVIDAIGALRAVYHCAGALDDGLVTQLDEAQIREVLRPKIGGASVLDSLTEDCDLHRFVLFSSVAGLFGSAGQSNYSAANAFMDGLAADRRARGKPALSIQWGPWAEAGMAANLSPADKARLSRQGLTMIEPTRGMRWLEAALACTQPVITIAPFERTAASALGLPLLSELFRAARTVTAGSLAERLRPLSGDDRVAESQLALQEQVARVIGGTDPTQVPIDRPLMDLGLDSLMAVELRNGLSTLVGRPLPATIAFDYPSVGALAAHLLAELDLESPTAIASGQVATRVARDRTPSHRAVPTTNVPIAIVGIGCRLPGGITDTESYWSLLRSGTDAITEIPADRWDVDAYFDPDPDAPGKMITRYGGFIDDVDRFDAPFFGIARREAVAMDPQQRLLLEVAWEALEDAGVVPSTLLGSKTGVYVGISNSDYSRLLAQHTGSADIDAYAGTGTTLSVAAGRLSYVLGLQGPAVSVDTACSSSLVATHLACQALRNGDCDAALAAGVNLILAPEPTIYFSKVRVMAPDGRCKTFDADADGYTRGEGCGVVVLERLDDAIAAGHRVLAVIRGTAVNQDGRSFGLTAPNGPAQEAVIRQALDAGGVAPADVGYVECHGTGTILGDPIEVQALAKVYGEGRDGRLSIGSVKTNIGHLESAAGVAGLIKAVLTLRHREIAPHLHLRTPNPRVDWDTLPLDIVTKPTPWAHPRRLAAVSSFGLSGTNAHIVIEGFEANASTLASESPPAVVGDRDRVFCLSGATIDAATEGAAALVAYLRQNPDVALDRVATTLAQRRTHHAFRCAVVATKRTQLIARLLSVDVVESGGVNPAFICGAELGADRDELTAMYRRWPVFAERVDHALGEPAPDRWARVIDQADVVAVGWALAELLKSFGVRLSAVVGHGVVGELTAAAVAGGLTISQAVTATRTLERRRDDSATDGPLHDANDGREARLAVRTSYDQLRTALGDAHPAIRIDAVIGPQHTVLAGPHADVDAAKVALEQSGLRTTLVARAAFDTREAIAASLPSEFGIPALPLFSTRAGRFESAEQWLSGSCQQARWPRVFEELQGTGGPLIVTQPGLQSMFAGAGRREFVGVCSSTGPLLQTIGALHSRGAAIDWSAVDESAAPHVSLPTYPFEPHRYWLPDPPAAGLATVGANGRFALSGVALALPGEATHRVVSLSKDRPAYLADHVIHGRVVAPGALYCSVMLAAAAEHFGVDSIALEDVQFERPLELDGTVAVHVVIKPAADGVDLALVTLATRQGEGWVQHAQASARVLDSAPVAAPLNPAAYRDEIEPGAIYAALAEAKVDWGESWQRIAAARFNGTSALVEINDRDDRAHALLHPVTLDNAFASGLALVLGSGRSLGDTPQLPFAVRRIRVGRAYDGGALRCVCTPVSVAQETTVVDLVLYDQQGAFATIEGFTTKRASRAVFAAPQEAAPFFVQRWVPSTRQTNRPASGTWAVLGADATSIADALSESGLTARAVDSIDAVSVEEALLVSWAPSADVEATVLEGLRIVQYALRAKVPRLAWITRGAQATTEDETPDLALASLWGFARTWLREHPQLDGRLVDLAYEADFAAVRRALDVTDEPELAVRADQLFAPRLHRAPMRRPIPDEYALEVTERGSLDGVALVEVEHPPLGDRDVRVRVDAAGMNFRDVINVLDVVGDLGPLGGEFAGEVVAAGDEVHDLRVGDAVMGVGPRCFARHVTVDERLVVRRGALDATEAASVPIAFLTAWVGLRDLGALAPGDNVLIHAAAGGVGMAAVQIAQLIGATVYATASAAKQPALRRMDVQHIASSRNADFATTFRDAGIDVVLNALANELTDAGLALLRDGGRFVEMGKTDLRDPAAVESQYPGVRYRPFDLATIMRDDPDRVQSMLRQVADHLVDGRLTPLSTKTFEVTDAGAALKFMAQARHIGKIVLTPPRATALRRPGTALITGGLGALGMEVAGWLAETSAVDHIVLLSRRPPEDSTAVDNLRRSMIRITVAACDVTDAASLQRILDDIGEEAPLRAVFHCAGVLDDGVVTQQTEARVAAVLAPKVAGAVNLDRLTRTAPLDAFVLFSSASALLGSPGQSSYAAANACIDALALRRVRAGLPALSIGWGPWSGAGMAASLSDLQRARLTGQGLRMIPPDRGVRWLGEAMAQRVPYLAVVPFEASALRRAVLPLLTDLASASMSTDTDLSETLARLGPDERLARMQSILQGEVAAVLGTGDASSVPAQRPLRDLGLDSLMAVELRNRISGLAGRSLPATIAFDYPNVAALARYLLDDVLELDDAPAPIVAVEPRRETGGPIAVIGMGVRFPGGANDPERFWQKLLEGYDAITKVPADRWDADALFDPDPDAPGKMITRFGGFIEDVDRFDASFFGITPREVASMDPQQRMLLEVGWEAIEDSGRVPDNLVGSSSGVYIGLSNNDYAKLLGRNGGTEDIDAYAGTGSSFSVAAGRLSYTFGLQGPAVVVDTACSSSLVAIHLACQALDRGECDLALAGGVNLILSPEATIYFSKIRVMAPDGHCKTFDDAADGYIRSEGCGVAVLARLEDAIANSDRILAVIRGSAVNQDGRSFGLTAPNGPSQEDVIRRALASARVSPRDVGYVECHGTGTALGDPIEVQALAKAYGDRETKLAIGSVKTNVGHLESAAGIVGFAKAVLAVERGRIPPHRNLQTPSSHIAWDEFPIEVPTEATTWPGTGPRVAGVSSFGFSGTNAHVIIEAPPGPAPRETSDNPTDTRQDPRHHLVPLSAKTVEALREVAARLSAQLGVASLPDVQATLAHRRGHHRHRLAVVATSIDALKDKLRSFANGDPTAGVVTGVAAEAPKIVMVFPGQGSQWMGMGRQLVRQEPVFAESIERVDAAMRRHADWSLIEVMQSDDREAVSRIDVVQPFLFAMEVALADLWAHWGVRPDAVIGQSMGEVAAAHVAGILSLDDAARIICRRSRLLLSVRGRGAMAVINLDAAATQAAIADHRETLAVAAISGPMSTVISGDPGAIDAVVVRLKSEGVFARKVKVDVASHSPQMDPLKDELRTELATVTAREATTTIISTVTGRPATGLEYGPEYWVDNLREPVALWPAVEVLVQSAHRIFIEVSPNPSLLAGIVEGLQHLGVATDTIETLRRGEDERATMLESLGRLHTLGRRIDWSAQVADAVPIRLPTYPWAKERHWFEATRRPPSELSGPVQSSIDANAWFWEQTISKQRLQTALSAPNGAMTELFAGVAQSALSTIVDVQSVNLVDIQPHPGVDATTDRRVQVALTRDGARRGHVRVSSQSSAESGWTTHLTADVRLTHEAPAGSSLYETVWQAHELEAKGPPRRTGRTGPWVLFGPVDDAADLAAELIARNETCIIATPGDRFAQLTPNRFVIDPNEPEHYRRVLGTVGPGTNIVGLHGGTARDASEATEATVRNMYVAQATASQPGLRLYFVVRGLGAAATWGLGRVIDREHADLVCTMIRDDRHNVGRVVDALIGAGEQRELAIDDGQIRVPRLVRTRYDDGAHAVVRGTQLVTGGLGGLGLSLAGALARHGAERIVLTSRRGRTPETDEAIEALVATGIEIGVAIEVIAGDVADARDVGRMLARCGPGLRGVFHLAGVRDDGLLANLDAERLRKVLAPKVTGAWNLHEATAGMALDHFVMYGSASSLLGTIGQANYAAANAFLDGLAEHRRSLGQPGLTVQWGPFASVGMVATDRFAGIESMTPSRGDDLLFDALRVDAPNVAAIDADWPAFVDAFAMYRNVGLLDALHDEAPRATGDADARAAIAAATGADRTAMIETLIAETFCAVTRLPRAQLDRTRPLIEYGLNSLMATELKVRVEGTLGVSVSLVTLLDGANLDALCADLAARLGAPPAPEDGEYEEGEL